jgi:hypothetical protein
MKIIMMFQKLNISGLKIPFLATSIMPLDVSAHSSIQILAMMRIVFFEDTFDHIAEFKKFTASFATPTIRSSTAKTKRMTINHSNIDHMEYKGNKKQRGRNQTILLFCSSVILSLKEDRDVMFFIKKTIL